jgi:hypothetical protein
MLLLACVVNNGDTADWRDVTHRSIVSRHNFGVIFEPIKAIYPVDKTYLHHLIITLPALFNFSTVQGGNDTSNTRLINRVLNKEPEGLLATLLKQETNLLNDLITAISQLIPENLFEEKSKRKRKYDSGWCLLVCVDSASKEQVDILKSFQQNESRIVQQNFAKIQKSINSLASFSTLTNERFAILETISQRQMAQASVSSKNENDIRNVVTTVLTSLLPHAFQLNKLYQSIVALKHNQLTFDLIAPQTANKVMNEIQKHVMESPHQYLVETDPLAFYTRTDFNLYRVQNDLHISLKFKLSPFSEPLMLYRVNQFPLSVNGQHTSFLEILPKFIAVGQDKESSYLSFQETPILNNDLTYDLNSRQHTLHLASQQTCLKVLLDDNVPQIARLCQTHVTPYNAFPIIMQVDETSILFSDVQTYEVKRTGQAESAREATNCSGICIKQFQCGTQISAGDASISLPSCAHNQTENIEDETSFVANLQVLGTLIPHEVLVQLSAGDRFFSPVNLTNDKLNFFSDNEEIAIKKRFQLLSSKSLTLIDAMNQTLEDGIIYTDPSQQLTQKFRTEGLAYKMSFNWGSISNYLTNPFSIGANLISMLQWAAIVYLYLRINNMQPNPIRA